MLDYVTLRYIESVAQSSALLWYLYFHLRTERILFGPPWKLKSIDKFEIVCNSVIKSTDSVKYLGLQIDMFLDCERIVLSIVQKVNARLKFLYRHANVLNTQSRIALTSALYTVSVWLFMFLMVWRHKQTLKQKLKVAQNKVVRFILDLIPRDSKQLRLNHVHNIFMAVHRREHQIFRV